jgi:VWFA-related protein
MERIPMPRFVFLALGLSALIACALPAQQAAVQPPQTSTLTLHASTQLVVLDVVVTDKKGNLVTTPLAKEDFTIVDDGKPQTIRYFEPPDQHRMPITDRPVVQSSADLPKIGSAPVTILVLDEMNNRFEDVSYARQMLEKYLRAQPAVLSSPTVLMVAETTTFQQLHDYTQSRDVLLAALKQHMPQFPTKANAHSGPIAVERIAQVLGALQQIAESSTGTPGRKNLVWVGSGFPSVDLANMNLDSTQVLEAAIRRVTSRLLASRVTLYTINPTLASTATLDIEDPSDLDYAADQNGGDPFDSGDISFAALAPSTGGVAFTGRNDINNLIATSIDQGRTYYTLEYRPTEATNVDPKKFRVVHVLLKDKNLRAVTRDGYYPQATDDLNPVVDKTLTAKQALANLQLDLSAALTTSVAYNGLTVTSERVGPGRYDIHVAEKGIEWSQMGPDGKQQSEVTIAAGWYDKKGKLIGHVIREEVSPRSTSGAGANYELPATKPGTAVRLRIVVRDTRNGHLGTVDMDHPQ